MEGYGIRGRILFDQWTAVGRSRQVNLMPRSRLRKQSRSAGALFADADEEFEFDQPNCI